MSDATYMALLTPPGRGAIASLAVRGTRAWDIARELFHFPPSAKVTELPNRPVTGRIWLGRLGEPGKGGSDDVVLCARHAEPIPWLELHCHGGDQAVGMICDVLARQGVVACAWQELERQAGARQLQLLAQQQLAQAPTLRVASILLDQFHGALARAVHRVLLKLENGEGEAADEELRSLLSRRQLGTHLVTPWRVVVAGAPNVGKSSLVNALAGFTRCLVSPEAGTTRDVVTTTLAIDGWPVAVSDTAGWHDNAASLERQGIERARQLASDADLCLWLLDGSAAPMLPEDPAGIMALVISKVDLPAAWDWQSVSAVGQVSSPAGVGIKELCAAIAQRLVTEAPAAGDGIPFTAELGEQIEQAQCDCRAGQYHKARNRLLELLS
ncbi:MAG: GTP-binding protein [Planctomycetes bacterium]|nr:GTP-binding protein [Planctomycetota bacterium]